MRWTITALHSTPPGRGAARRPWRTLASALAAWLLGGALPGGALPGTGAGLEPVSGGPLEAPPRSAEHVRGMTISCQTWGQEWGTDAFAEALDELVPLGVNWVAFHPYAWIRADGSVEWRPFDDTTRWLVRPIEEAHRRGLSVLVKPHLGYWGSPFAWRGEIDFPAGEARERFFRDYRAWIEELAQVTRGADAFAVGTELDRLIDDDAAWRGLIASVRTRTEARLTYAANWTDFERVSFWDALDAIGVQAYFPLVGDGEAPDRDALLRGWERVLTPLRELSERSGKPVVFSELGYDLSLDAAREPWRGGRVSAEERDAARELQSLCLDTALDVLAREREWLRGGFLWKWFAGPAPRANFRMDTESTRAVMAREWGPLRLPEAAGAAPPTR